MSFPLEAQGRRRRGEIHRSKGGAKSQTSGRQSSGRKEEIERLTTWKGEREGGEGVSTSKLDRNKPVSLERKPKKGPQGIFLRTWIVQLRRK